MEGSRRRLVDPAVREEVELVARRYFVKEPIMVEKEEVIKFMRYYSTESHFKDEPFPNCIEGVMKELKTRVSASKMTMDEFLDTVAEFYSK